MDNPSDHFIIKSIPYIFRFISFISTKRFKTIMVSTQLIFTCSKLTKETLKKCVKYVRWTVHFRPTYPSDRNQKIYLHCKSITVFFYDKNNGIKWDTKTSFLLFCLPSFYRSKVSVI